MGWQQLTYASLAGSEATPGGWQVQGALPADLTAPIRDHLRARVVTRLLEVKPTDDLASHAELQARPRRLLYERKGAGPTWWHAVNAGKDATGRPGNVFTHAALLTDAPGDLRPIDLWRSPDWLDPFGQLEVEQARLAPFGSPGPLGREAAVACIHRHADELEVVVAAIAWLLAAPGRSVVLLAETPDEFAEWVAAACHLTAPAIARRIPFVTYERAHEGFEVPVAGLVGVPVADRVGLAELFEDPDVLVLDLGDLPVEPEDGWWASAGQRWPEDPLWQGSLYGASGLEARELGALLATLDEVMAPLGESEPLDPGWPLALALLKVAPQRLQGCADLVRRWQAEQPWSGLRDADVLARLAGERPEPAPVLEPDRVVPALAEAAPVDELRVLVAAAQRILEHPSNAGRERKRAAQRFIHLLLTDGFPRRHGPESIARVKALLALGEELPASVAEVLREWRSGA